MGAGGILWCFPDVWLFKNCVGSRAGKKNNNPTSCSRAHSFPLCCGI